MPASRARTAICSAPLECPSSPGLPTRIFTPRPRCSPRRATSSRSSASSSPLGTAAASPTPLVAPGPPCVERRALLRLHLRIDDEDPAIPRERGRLALREAIDADEHLLAR